MEPLTRIAPLMDSIERTKTLQQRKWESSDDLRKVARDFEAIFLENLLKTMRRTIPKGGLLDGGQSEEIYTFLFDREIAQRMAQRSIGLADLIQRQLEQQRRPEDTKVDIRV